MATKDKKPVVNKGTEATKVTRITANDTQKQVVSTSPVKKDVAAPTTRSKPSVIRRTASPFIGLGQYFKGAWYELQQVTWPNRKSAISLTIALLIFTAFFAVIILLLDAFFKYLFELVLS